MEPRGDRHKVVFRKAFHVEQSFSRVTEGYFTNYMAPDGGFTCTVVLTDEME